MQQANKNEREGHNFGRENGCCLSFLSVTRDKNVASIFDDFQIRRIPFPFFF